jgi:phosphate/sulfate permease
MPLTDREAFKVGFLKQCATEGLSPDEILSRVKTASYMLEKRAFIGGLIGGAANAAGGALKTVGSYGLPLALAAPPILGGLAGYGLAKATDVDDTDVDAIKNRELVEEYRRQAEKLKRQRAVRDYTQQVQSTGRMFM